MYCILHSSKKNPLNTSSTFSFLNAKVEDLRFIYTHFLFCSPILFNFFFFMFVEKVIEY
jgi:hypothetical protein